MTLSEVLSAQAEIELAKKRANHAEDEFCNEHCPVKIGDVVTITGHSHRGKLMRVTRVRLYKYSMGRYNSFSVYGDVLKKDGTVGANISDMEVMFPERVLAGETK